MERAPGSVSELLALALGMERAAAARYAALTRRMAERDEDELADLFSRLGRLERDHARFIERRLAGRPPAPVLDAPAPEAIALESEAVLTPRAVLCAALRSEQDAQAHFERIAAAAGEAAVRRLAADLAAEEADHAARIAAALARYPDPAADRGDPRAAAPVRPRRGV
jgi:rubrerythrin